MNFKQRNVHGQGTFKLARFCSQFLIGNSHVSFSVRTCNCLVLSKVLSVTMTHKFQSNVTRDNYLLISVRLFGIFHPIQSERCSRENQQSRFPVTFPVCSEKLTENGKMFLLTFSDQLHPFNFKDSKPFLN